jgi:hypothetical protein
MANWRPSDRQITRVIEDLVNEFRKRNQFGCVGDCGSTFGAGCTLADAEAVKKALAESPSVTPGSGGGLGGGEVGGG